MDYFILTHFFRPFLFFVRSPSCTYNIEQVAGFHYDGAIGRPAEHVFLAVRYSQFYLLLSTFSDAPSLSTA